MNPRFSWLLAATVGCSTPGGDVKTSVDGDTGDPVTDPGTDDTDDTHDTVDSGEDTAEDTGDTGEDTDPPEWVALPNSCEPPTPDGTDPFIEVGSEINQTGPWFTEILDLSYLPAVDLVLTAGQGGVAVFDVSNLADPDTQGHLGADPGPFERYYHVEPGRTDRMFATHRDVGLHILSYEDRENLEQTARANAVGYEGLDWTGDRVYVTNIGGEVDVYDVTSDDTLTWVSTTPGLDRPWDILVDDTVAYVADGGLGLTVLSLADPDAPTIVTSIPTGGQAVRLEQDPDGYVYVAASSGGIEVFETSDPLAPTRVATLDVGGGALDVTVHDGLVGATTQEAVVLYDVGRSGTPEAPVPFAYEETELFAMALHAEASVWAVGDWNILSTWEVGTDPAPAIDLSIDGIAFLDEAETREVTITNRGSSDLDLASIGLPGGLTALVNTPTIAPGETGILAVSWDGTTELPRGTALCVMSDDPGRPEVILKASSGADGEGKAIGQNAPDFSLADLDGTVHRLSDQLGHPVVLAYFATW